VIGVLLAVAGAYGVFLLYTRMAFGWSGFGFGPSIAGGRRGDRARRGAQEWLVQAGLEDVRTVEFVAVSSVLLVAGAALAFALFGGVVAPVAAGLFAASFPISSARARRSRRRADAREAWPRMIEEIRVLTGSAGRSIPHALFEVGLDGPPEVRRAFAAAHREWLLTTDFGRTIAVLKSRLADATADAACETLLVAHEVGGTDVDRRLAALVDDRIVDLQGRKDADSKMAGVRFARRFVLVVPIGMALVGLSIGDGRAAYRTGTGQAGIAVGIGLLIACWIWSGRIMRIPDEQRVFT
jgi:tight adherence protein B